MSAPAGRVEPVVSAQFGRLQHGGVLLGLHPAQLVLVATGLVVAVTGVYTAGPTGLAVGAPVWLTLLVAGLGSVRGRPVVAWVPLLATWSVRRLTGATTAVTSVRDRTPARLVLPGLGRLEVQPCPALKAVLVVDRAAGTWTAVLALEPAGFVLASPIEQVQAVQGWDRVLGGLCRQPGVARAQLLVRSRSGGLAPARAWWRQHTTTGPAAVLADLLDTAFTDSVRREHLLAVALRPPRARNRALRVEASGQQLTGVTDALSAAGLQPGAWLDAPALAAVVAAGYDPSVQAARLEDVAPTGVAETWSALRTEGAVHATFWVAEWPRAAVHAAFLQPLLLGEEPGRSWSLIVEPIPTGRALRDIRRAKAEHAADAVQRQRWGQIEDASVTAEVADLAQREAELVAGHGDLRFTGLLTLTAPTEEVLAARCAAAQTAAAASMCELRRLVGQQGLAHAAAALPLARGVL
ncbi:SCO6880 family protein [Cellulomonas endophytica]|uniref:SCO6880 family protein n=1 Tax=Cellulomonas endophytica TaxID=2494735 RepID=UPI001010CEFD|nr:SCO6880 family protein [Cellulomonas endophytica]